MGFLDSVLRRNSELESLFDLDFANETSQRAYLKKWALEICINFIGRTISQADFRILQNKKRQFDDWHYLLNVRPNTDQSASNFWQSFVYKLIDENEVLVILTDDNDLLIADDFVRTEYAVYPDVFTDVTVKDYTFKRSFEMHEVIYLKYNNERLSKFMAGMFDDYADLFSRMIEIAMRNYQIRGTVDLDVNQKLDDETQGKLQKFIDKLFASFKKNTVALVPKMRGFSYTEVADGDQKGQPIEELTKLKRSIVDDVADILGIPSALLHGELADYETSIKAYIKFCVTPLLKMIQDELNAKIVEKDDYLKGSRIEVKFISYSSIFEISDHFDKLVASGGFTRNELREEVGYEASDDPELDKFVITKNYQSADSVEGGDGK